VVITVALWCAADDATWSAEIIPLLLFGMTAAIAYEKELALLLAAPLDADFAFAFSWPSHGWLIALGIVPQSLGWLLISTLCAFRRWTPR
jgi:general stress protein CsbA